MKTRFLATCGLVLMGAPPTQQSSIVSLDGAASSAGLLRLGFATPPSHACLGYFDGDDPSLLWATPVVSCSPNQNAGQVAAALAAAINMGDDFSAWADGASLWITGPPDTPFTILLNTDETDDCASDSGAISLDGCVVTNVCNGIPCDEDDPPDLQHAGLILFKLRSENGFGTQEQARAIEQTMFEDTTEDEVIAVIDAARETRGAQVGCPELELPRLPIDDTEPGLSAIASVWNAQAANIPTPSESTCPVLGRAEGAMGLGGWYALLAFASVDVPSLIAIAENAMDVQYTRRQTRGQPVIWPGVYGLAEMLSTPDGDCERRGVVAQGIAEACALQPALCPPYTRGRWTGENFVVGDFFLDPTPPSLPKYDGGLAFDHGWTATMMLEAGLALPQTGGWNAIRSFLAAADWSDAEPPVRNHNYTAMNIWVLAQAYGLTGSPRYREALLDKLARNLKPGVLMDLVDEATGLPGSDGLVDGMVNRPFQELSLVARRPGRMWDSHNSLMWYGAMNAWAMTEAYVALRDRGDAEACELRPYAVAMLDNIAWELENLGPPFLGAHSHPIPYALGIGLWKVAQCENEPHENWERAAWILWNTSYFSTFAERGTANTALYLLVKSCTPYVPLAQRLAKMRRSE